jgi:hypothetical protein
MCQMVSDGEVDHLVAERVWQEVSRGLMEQQPSRMFDVLRQCGALARLLPELDRLWGVPQSAEHHPEVDTGVHVMLVLDLAAQLNTRLAVRFACLTHDLGKGTTPATVLPRHIGHEERSVRLLKGLCQRLRVPVECKELADVVAREHGNIHRCESLNAAATVRLLERCDAIRKPARFADILMACECDATRAPGTAGCALPAGGPAVIGTGVSAIHRYRFNSCQGPAGRGYRSKNRRMDQPGPRRGRRADIALAPQVRLRPANNVGRTHGTGLTRHLAPTHKQGQRGDAADIEPRTQ